MKREREKFYKRGFIDKQEGGRRKVVFVAEAVLTSY
jgi:hypothetical protein